MKVLIVESDEELGTIWARHLKRYGFEVTLACDQAGAIDALRHGEADVIVLNLILREGSSLAVADFASYRHPDARVIFVTDTTFFSDGSIFSFAPNACAYLRTQTPLDDLAAMVEHYGGGFAPSATHEAAGLPH
ncbi:response regulator [Oceanicola sp. D3]|uniref:response regulator transcription factor n=1 Tax=Oceanicola sp. D3 TaxID=2587163 RepID=UPI001121DE78|nr:response regulator [Oceanicola sp. D3]QDC08344.1 response regulator [Oceanicola sp. D3]